jgi:hypothetical protein
MLLAMNMPRAMLIKICMWRTKKGGVQMNGQGLVGNKKRVTDMLRTCFQKICMWASQKGGGANVRLSECQGLEESGDT